MAGKLKYALYVIFHPFKGFWDIKHEKRGSVPAALVLLGIYVLTSVLKGRYSGFLFNEYYPGVVNASLIIIQSVMIYLLWCIANWCLTTLMDGEGGFKDIVTAIGYCVTPLIFGNIASTVLSNVVLLKESVFITYIDVVCILWTGFLVLCATLVVHQYTMLKTVATSLLTVVGMMILVFIVLLCVSLVQQMLGFVDAVYKEFTYRL